MIIISRIKNYLTFSRRMGYLKLFGSKVNEPSKILIKTMNIVEYIESYIQKTGAPRIDDLII